MLGTKIYQFVSSLPVNFTTNSCTDNIGEYFYDGSILCFRNSSVDSRALRESMDLVRRTWFPASAIFATDSKPLSPGGTHPMSL